MTDKTGNSKIRPPKLAITKEMIEAGKAKLDELTAMSIRDDIANDEPTDNITDDLLVAEVFLACWNVYWSQVMGEQRKAQNKSNVIMMPKKEILRP